MKYPVKAFLIFFASLFFSCALIHGQSDSTAQKQNLPKRFSTDITHAAKSVLYVYKRPFSWKKREWATFGGVLGTAALASFLDEPMNDFFLRNQSKYLDPFADFGDFMGQPEYQGPFLIAFWGIGIAADNEWMRSTGSMLGASMAASGLIQTLSKEAVGRARPSRGTGNLDFKPFGGINYHSFPSGHTMLALSTAWILARQVKPLALKIIFYAVPAIVGWSRVYDNAHWFSDIILGSALGIATAEAVIRYHSSVKNIGLSQTGLKITGNGNGISLAYRF